jgi:hypothetical protein
MNSLRKILFVTLFTAAGGTLLHAQTAEVSGSASASASATATVSGNTQAKISAEDMKGQVTTLTAQAGIDAHHVEQLRLTARRQKDVIKLNCVNDKYLQIKSLLNLMDEASARLEVAILSKDEDARYHEYTMFTVSAEKVRALRGEADGCVGEELTYLGETVVDVKKPEIPDDPTDDNPFDNVIEPPAYASPFD